MSSRARCASTTLMSHGCPQVILMAAGGRPTQPMAEPKSPRRAGFRVTAFQPAAKVAEATVPVHFTIYLDVTYAPIAQPNSWVSKTSLQRRRLESEEST